MPEGMDIEVEEVDLDNQSADEPKRKKRFLFNVRILTSPPRLEDQNAMRGRGKGEEEVEWGSERVISTNFTEKYDELSENIPHIHMEAWTTGIVSALNYTHPPLLGHGTASYDASSLKFIFFNYQIPREEFPVRMNLIQRVTFGHPESVFPCFFTRNLIFLVIKYLLIELMLGVLSSQDKFNIKEMKKRIFF